MRPLRSTYRLFLLSAALALLLALLPMPTWLAVMKPMGLALVLAYFALEAPDGGWARPCLPARTGRRCALRRPARRARAAYGDSGVPDAAISPPFALFPGLAAGRCRVRAAAQRSRTRSVDPR